MKTTIAGRGFGTAFGAALGAAVLGFSVLTAAPAAGDPAPGPPAPGAGAGVQPAAAPLAPAFPPPNDPRAAAPAPVAKPALVPAKSGTLRDYFAEHGVELSAQVPTDITDLRITLPLPPGWTQVPDPNVPDAFAVIANRRTGALYTPNTQIVVYRLTGAATPPVDAAEAITHGFVDSEQLLAWQTTRASMTEHDGVATALIEGTYRENDMTLNTSRQHTIIGSGANMYLVSMATTTGIREAVANAPSVEAIVKEFRVEPVTHSAD